MNPEVSVIIPCHNSESTISRCVDSLINQTTDAEYELIFINDGSTDKTGELLDNYSRSSECNITIINTVNRGAWAARRIGIALANGKYITFLDSDDTAKPIMINTLLNRILVTQSDICVGGFERVSSKNDKILSKEFCNKYETLYLSKDPGAILEINPAPWNKLFKTVFLKKICDIKPHPKMFDDLCLLLLAIQNGADKVCFTPDIIVDYYVNPNSIINSVELSDVQNGREALKGTFNTYENTNVQNKFKDAFWALAFEHLLVSMSFRLSQNKSVNLKESISTIAKWLNEDYPGWCKSKFLTLSYCITKNNATKRLWIAYRIYKVKLLGLLLTLYRILTTQLNIDIKW